MEETYDSDSSPDQSGQRSQFLSLTIILAFGVLIYEATHLPTLAAIVMCLKFGMTDFRTAFWFRRTDPIRLRGKISFWMHMAGGMFATAVVSFFMAIAIGIINAIVEPPPKPGDDPLKGDVAKLAAGAVIGMFSGIFLVSICTYRAIFLSRKSGFPIWFDHIDQRTRQENLWPPSTFDNRATFYTLLSLGITLIFFIPGLLYMLYAIWHEILGYRGWRKPVFAKDPEEFWPELADPKYLLDLAEKAKDQATEDAFRTAYTRALARYNSDLG